MVNKVKVVAGVNGNLGGKIQPPLDLRYDTHAEQIMLQSRTAVSRVATSAGYSRASRGESRQRLAVLQTVEHAPRKPFGVAVDMLCTA